MYRSYPCNYKKLNNLIESKEKYFVSYAIRGPTVTLKSNCNCMNGCVCNNCSNCQHDNKVTNSKCSCTYKNTN